MLLVFLILIHYAGPPTNLAPWFDSLRSKAGGYCCAEADGRDVEYDTKNGHYRILLDGQWIDVLPQTVIQGPNLHGHAMAWIFYEDGKPYVRCFIPGAGI